MKHFVQLDNNVVTAQLYANDAPPPETCPPGRTFIEVTDDEASEISGGDMFDPLVADSRKEFPASHRNMHGFTKAVKAPQEKASDPVSDKLDQILARLPK